MRKNLCQEATTPKLQEKHTIKTHLIKGSSSYNTEFFYINMKLDTDLINREIATYHPEIT